jgi:hypothetical protein
MPTAVNFTISVFFLQFAGIFQRFVLVFGALQQLMAVTNPLILATFSCQG